MKNFVSLLIICCIASIVQSQTISVDFQKQHQTIEGFGGFGPKKVWWNSGPWHDADYLTQTMDSMGTTIFRTQIYWDLENTNDNNDPAVTDLTKFNYGANSNNGKQFPFISDVAAKGGKIIATVWTPPTWMKLFDDASRIPSQCYNCNCPVATPYPENRKMCGGSVNPAYYEEFAEYLAAYVKIVKQQTGVDIYAINIQNEPMFANPFEACVVRPEEFADILKVVGERFKQDNLPTKLFGPEHMGEYSGNMNYIREILEDPSVNPHLDFWSVHSYTDGVAADYGSAGGWTSIYNEVYGKYGRQLWMTETSDGNASGFTLGFNMAKSLYLALKFGHISGWVYWYFADVAIQNNQLTPLGYAFKNFYRYIKPGASMVESSSTDAAILNLAFINPNGEIVILLINNASTTKTASLSLPAEITELRTWRTSSSQNTEYLGKSNPASLSLPAQSITTLVYAGTPFPTIDKPHQFTFVSTQGEITIPLNGITDGGSNTQTLELSALFSNPSAVISHRFEKINDTQWNLIVTPAQVGATTTVTVQVKRPGTDFANTRTISFPVKLIKFINQKPNVNAIPDTAVALNNSNLSYSVVARGINDGNDGSQKLTFKVSSNTSVISRISVTPYAGTDSAAIKFRASAQGNALVTLTIIDDGGTDLDGENTKSVSFQVTVTEPLGNNLIGADQVTIAPNPVDNELNVTWSNARFTQWHIVNLSGVTLRKGLVTDTNLNIATADLKAGCYFLILKGDQTYRTTFLKK